MNLPLPVLGVISGKGSRFEDDIIVVYYRLQRTLTWAPTKGHCWSLKREQCWIAHNSLTAGSNITHSKT